MKKIINMSPTISNLTEESLKISGSQIPYFRTNEFSKLMKDNEKMLLKLMGCKGRTIFLSGSGTGGMDSVVSNLIDSKDKVLIINGGSFGQRWVDICNFYRLDIFENKVKFGESINFSDLKEVITTIKPSILLMQFVETSSGQKHDIERIAELCKQYNVKLFVDSISSFLSEEYNMDKLGVDVTIISSQKGVGLFPGLSMVILSTKMIKEEFKKRSFYLDYKKYLEEELVTPFTPNVSVLLQLNQRLKDLNLKKEIRKRRGLANNFRFLIKQLPLKIIAENPSNAVTGLYTERNDVKKFFKKMCKKNIYFSPIRDNAFVVSHMGNLTKKDNLIFVGELKKWLK